MKQFLHEIQNEKLNFVACICLISIAIQLRFTFLDVRVSRDGCSEELWGEVVVRSGPAGRNLDAMAHHRNLFKKRSNSPPQAIFFLENC